MVRAEQPPVDTKSIYMHSFTRPAVENRGHNESGRRQETTMLINMGTAEVSRLTDALLNGMSSDRPFWTPERRAVGLELLSAAPIALIPREILFMTYLHAIHNVTTLEASESLIGAGQIIFPHLTNNPLVRTAIAEAWTAIADINSLPTEQILERVSENLDTLGAKEKILRRIKKGDEIVLIEPLPHAPFVKEERRGYVEAWNGTMTYEEMAARLGVSMTTIHDDVQWLLSNGKIVPGEQQPLTARRLALIKEWQKGTAQKDIAIKFDRSPAWVTGQVRALVALGLIQPREGVEYLDANIKAARDARDKKVTARKARVIEALGDQNVTAAQVAAVAKQEGITPTSVRKYLKEHRNQGK